MVTANMWLTCGYMAHKGLEGGYIACAKDESGRQRDWRTRGGSGGGRKVAGYSAERFSLLSSLRIHGAGFNWMDTIAWCLIN